MDEIRLNHLAKSMRNTVGNNLKFYRKKKGLTQTDLAVKLINQREFISRIERGRANIQLSTLIKIADSLQIEAYELLQTDIEQKEKA